MNLSLVLSEAYNLTDCIITEQQRGWTSLAYRVENSSGVYFLKVYEKKRKSTSKWTALIDNYITIVIWLNNNFLKYRIIEPLLTSDNTYKYEDENIICLLFNYIDGETIGEKPLDDQQVEELADIISELHSHGDDVPSSTEAITENYELTFNNELLYFLDAENENRELKDVISPFSQKIKGLIERTENIKKLIKQKNISFVLCHTDIHNWNLMQTKENLVLIDWEGLKYAPAENDLYALVNEPYFDNFLSKYKEKHKNYTIDEELITFYQLRRKMEDIWEFVELLMTPELKDDIKKENLFGLKNELISL
ncbi:MAG: aminoglycoside phosphotransferase family protein [Dysgonomonas sp.]|nr:aminoglycoside phosphotransferase family protein [Dysgonomonas sp.]